MESILLHIYDDIALESRLQAEFDLARAFDGHITCLHATPIDDYLAIDPVAVVCLPEEFSEKMKSLRLALQARLEERLIFEYLARHAIEGEIIQRLKADGGDSDVIERPGLEPRAGLIVMVASGHSHLREFLLGGVTHDLINRCRLPLLLGR